MGFFLNSRVKFLDPWNLPDLPVIAGLWFATELQPRCRWHFRESGSFQEVAQRYCSWANLGLVSWLADVYRTRIQGWTGSQWHVRPLRAFTLWGCFTVEIAQASPALRPTAYGMSGWCISAVTSMEKLGQQRLAWSCCLLHVTTTDQDHWALKTTEALQAREREREKKKNEKWEIEDIAENGQVCGSIGVPILIHAQYAAASWLGKTMVDTRDAQEMEGEAAALAGSAHWYYSLTSSMLELLELSNVNWTTLDCCSSKEYINRLRHLKPGAFGPPIYIEVSVFKIRSISSAQLGPAEQPAGAFFSAGRSSW